MSLRCSAGVATAFEFTLGVRASTSNPAIAVAYITGLRGILDWSCGDTAWNVTVSAVSGPGTCAIRRARVDYGQRSQRVRGAADNFVNMIRRQSVSATADHAETNLP